MAEQLADVVAQIQNVRQLEAVVSAMRGIAASRAQRGRSLLAGIDAYSDVISRAIGQALILLPADTRYTSPPRAGRVGLILFCAEQGFAGAFSERILDTAARDDLTTSVIFLIGTRGMVIANERGLKPAWSAPMATHVDAVPALANRIADALYAHVAAAALSKVYVVVSRSSLDIGISIDRHSLLPVDLGRFAQPPKNQPPLTTLSSEILLERLTAEYVYAQLCKAAMHAFAAENEARMLAMASARTNIDTKLKSLTQREQRLRQEEITTEIVELAAGAEASRTMHR
jgi:F-type H+-transporting ATPase subunit gamma